MKNQDTKQFANTSTTTSFLRRLLIAISIAGLITGCGQSEEPTSDTKIVGGVLPSEDDAVLKHTVALVTPEGDQFCTGTLITKTWVVSASHCLVGYDEDYLFLAFGPVAKHGHFARERLRYAVKFKVHESYNTTAMRQEEASSPPNDIALVVMNEAAPEGFEPVPVMRKHNPLHVGEKLLLAGYGITSGFGRESGTMYKVETKLIEKSDVAKEFTFGETPGRSACRGDSGGPAFVYRGGELALVGVTSRGSYFCNDTGIYTDIRFFIDWLIEAGNS